jgi:hypothetical protein
MYQHIDLFSAGAILRLRFPHKTARSYSESIVIVHFWMSVIGFQVDVDNALATEGGEQL